MVTKSITISKKVEKGQSPVALFVQEANRFESRIMVQTGNKSINAKSIMGIMAFNPSEGMSVNIVTEGSDEQEALLAIERFLVCE